MTGVWVLAHECGHESFSESDFWNNVFGINTTNTITTNTTTTTNNNIKTTNTNTNTTI